MRDSPLSFPASIVTEKSSRSRLSYDVRSSYVVPTGRGFSFSIHNRMSITVCVRLNFCAFFVPSVSNQDFRGRFTEHKSHSLMTQMTQDTSQGTKRQGSIVRAQ